MPEKKTTERAAKDKKEGKSPSTQAGEFVREEIHHVREGKHGAKNAKQAIAIGLSKARRAGVKLPAPKRGRTSASTRRKAAQDTKQGEQHPKRKPSPKRSRARVAVLKKEGKGAASKQALSRQGRDAAARRTKADRSRAAKKGAATRNANRKKREEARKHESEQAQAH